MAHLRTLRSGIGSLCFATRFTTMVMNETTTKIFPYLERLLDGEEVEWKTLGEVGTFVRGTSFQKKHFVEKGVGCIHYGEIYTRYGLFAKKTISYLNEEIANKARKASYGDLIIATTSENDDDVCKSVAWLGSESIVVSNDACYYHHTLNPKYVAYFFRTDEFQRQKRTYITGTKVKRVNANDLAKITLPIPPLRVQARIVEILDKFTQLEAQLEAELQAELEARRKQYAYYRDQLLNFSQYPPLNVNIEWRTLGEVCLVQRGASPRPIAHYLTNSPNGVPWIKIGDTKVGSKYIESTQERITIEGAQRSRQLSAGDFILSNSMSYGRPYILKIDGAIHDGWASLSEISSSILSDYLFYFLSSSKVQMYWEGKINSGSVSNLNADIIKALPIPIPPLSEQRRIVDILDRFDTLTNSISEGLPKEIALRRKQYAYYRDALLSFPRPEVSA